MQLHAGSPEEAGMLPAQIELTRQRLKQWSEEGVTPALVVLAARRGVIVLHEALGRLGPSEDSPPVQLDTLFPLASISKVITATAIMTLVEDGLLGLSRRVQEYVPQFVGEGKEQVMVHHLLTHTSGLRDTVVGAHAESKKDKVTIPLPEADQHPEIHEYLYLESDAPLSEPPGREMSYSNTGYLLLGEIIRRVSGKGFGHFVTERIFEPLGMHDSFFVPTHARDRVVRRSADLPFAGFLDDPSYLERPAAWAGGYSTALDMAAFCQMFLNHGSYGQARILSPPSVSEMTRNQIPRVASKFKEDYEIEASRGYGWDVKGAKKPRYHGSLDSPLAFTHQGAGGTSIVVDPAYDLVTIYFSVARGVMTSARYSPEWSMDHFTNMVTAAVVDG